MKAGRKRKTGARYASGRRKDSQRAEDVMATALEARRRHFGVTTKQAKDERLGSALGRLAFQRIISDVQFQAGQTFATLHRKYMIAFGLPSLSAKSAFGSLINEGIFGIVPGEVPIDTVDKIRRRYGNAVEALNDCDREQHIAAGERPTQLVFRVICSDEDIVQPNAGNIGNLRVGLNALARIFKLE